MESYFKTLFEDGRHENLLIIILSIINSEVFPNHEVNVIKNLAVEKIHRQIILKEYVALHLLEKKSLFIK